MNGNTRTIDGMTYTLKYSNAADIPDVLRIKHEAYKAQIRFARSLRPDCTLKNVLDESELSEYLSIRAEVASIHDQRLQARNITGMRYDVRVASGEKPPEQHGIMIDKKSRTCDIGRTSQRNRAMVALLKRNKANGTTWQRPHGPHNRVKWFAQHMTYVNTPQSRNVIATQKTRITKRFGAICKHMDLPTLALLENEVKRYKAKGFVSIAQACKAHRRIGETMRLAELTYGGQRPKRRKVQTKTHQQKTQYIIVTCNETGEEVASKRYKLASKNDKGFKPTGKLKTGKAVRTLAKRHGIKLTRHDIIPSGQYVGKTHTMEVR